MRHSSEILALLWFLLTLAAPTVCWWAPPTETHQIEVSAKLSGRAVQFEVTILEPAEVEVNPALLPWGNVYSTLLVAVTPDGKTLQRALIIDDPGSSRLRLLKGLPVRGVLDLDEAFPTLREAVRKSEVILFWSYVLKTTDGVVFPRQGGWLLLPKAQ